MQSLDNALSQLAESLGVHSEDFVTWLTNGGLESYANLQIMKNAIWILVSIVCCIICVKLFIYGRKRQETAPWSDDFPVMAIVFSAILFVVSGVACVSAIIDALSWLLYPDGMIVQMLLSMM